MVVPGARFNGLRDSDVFSSLFGSDDRQDVSVAAPAQRIEVRPIPAAASQPWLPLRDLRLRYLRKPSRARAGEAVQVEIGMTAEGATGVQLPPLELKAVTGAQVFADPAQTDTQVVDGKLRATLRRTFSLVPGEGGLLTIPGPSVSWWDATAGVARTTQLPPLQLDVASASGALGGGAKGAPAGGANAAAANAAANGGERSSPSTAGVPGRWAIAASLAGVLLLVSLGICFWRRRLASASGGQDRPLPAPLAKALDKGDFAQISLALTRQANLQADDLEGVLARLDDASQRSAVALLQSALWGDGSADDARRALRAAFAAGARWQKPASSRSDLLPPLYPM